MIRIIISLFLFIAYSLSLQAQSSSFFRENSPLQLLPFNIQKQILDYKKIWKTNFDVYIIDWRDIHEGGPSRDIIPAISNPNFNENINTVNIPDNEPVIVLRFAKKIFKAYPIRYLMWHEIINDSHDNNHFAVTYNPLYGTYHVFSRLIEQQILEFKSTGKLYFGNSLYYDTLSESWWQQANAKALVGLFTGEQLPSLPFELMSFNSFKQLPGHLYVMTAPENTLKPYGKSAYGGFTKQNKPFQYPQAHHPFLPIFEPIISINNRQLAMSFRFLKKYKRIELPNNIIVRWFSGMANPLDQSILQHGNDMGFIKIEQWGKIIPYHIDYAYAHYLLAPNARYIDEK